MEKKEDNKGKTNSCPKGFAAIKSYEEGIKRSYRSLDLTVKRTMGGREDTNHCNRRENRLLDADEKKERKITFSR